MARDWESTFRLWAKPPSQSEIDRCDKAVAVVRNAIRSFEAFATHDIEVFAQGSYRNGTNVRASSDVDVCVRSNDFCFSSRSDDISQADTGLVDSTYTFGEFKAEVGQALSSYLGVAAVSRGNKAFDLHANTYRVDADVVPTFEHRRYFRDSYGDVRFESGTEFCPDNGGRIINWPEQNYCNGVDKNKLTNYRFKKMVRILKHAKNEMAEDGNLAALRVPSYLVECLVWNVPDRRFGGDTYAANLRAVLDYLHSSMSTYSTCSVWREVNEIKHLFREGQPWARESAHAFVAATLRYCELE